MIRIAINLFDAQESRNVRQSDPTICESTLLMWCTLVSCFCYHI